MYYQRGWLPATAGNLSLRDGESHFWITASGLDKGRLEPGDFLRIRLDDGSPDFTQKPNQKPSAETSIHRAIYNNHPEAGSVFHIHNPDSLKIQPGLKPDSPIKLWTVPPTELVKAMGFWDENPKLFLPIVYNYSKVEEIARAMEKYFQETKGRDDFLPAVLVENHGPSIWGKDTEETHRHLEAMEYILKVSDYYATRCI